MTREVGKVEEQFGQNFTNEQLFLYSYLSLSMSEGT